RTPTPSPVRGHPGPGLRCRPSCAWWRRLGSRGAPLVVEGALGADQAGVGPVLGAQLLMAAALHHLAAVQVDDLVRVADGAEAVGHDEAGATPPPQAAIHHPLGFGVE